MLNPARPFIVWLSTQIVMLFVIMNVIPEHVADMYIEALATGVTYLMGAAMSFYYMKKLHDNQDKLDLPREKVEELIKKGISHIPYSHPTTTDTEVFHDEQNQFFTTDQDPAVGPSVSYGVDLKKPSIDEKTDVPISIEQ